MRSDASPRPEKSVCHLQGLARTSVTVDALRFGQIWFRSVIRVRRTGVLTDRATGKHLPSSPTNVQRLKWTLFHQFPPTSEAEWLCVDVDGYKIVNVYKPPPIRLQVSDFPIFPHPCLYAGDFNCQHVDWGYDANSAEGKCLVGWANTNNLVLLHNPKDAARFHSGRWNTKTNPDLAFVSIDSENRLPNRQILEKFPRSQPGMWKRLFFNSFRFHTYRFRFH